MSAIFGVYNLDGKPVSPQLLEKMSNILKHRGTDNSGVWSDTSIGLGHRMLGATPESQNEKLPHVSIDKSLVITADARLDNREQLIDLLSPFAKDDSLITDSELILSAYKKWGDGCAEHLLGDFAFAVWDTLQQKLFCARDHFGVKPFYYYASGNLFTFATEIKALLLLPEVPRRLNEVKLAHHIEGLIEDRTHTFYQDIFRLLPGCYMKIDRDEKKTSSYWSLELSRELKLSSDNEYAEALREHFAEAVRCRLRSPEPIGTMLSGGIDSSSITCMARKLLAADNTKQLHTFSAVFDEVKECDERPYIDAVLRGNSLKPHFFTADKHGPFTDIEEIHQAQDEPLFHGNLYVNWLSYKIAKNQGIKVVLDGFDGDNTISHGLGFFTELAHAGRWARLLSENIAYARKIDESWSKAAWSWIWYFGLNPWISENQYASRARSGVSRVKGKIGANKKLAIANQSHSNGVELNSDFAKRLVAAKPDKAEVFYPRTERETQLSNLVGNGPPFTLEVLDHAAAASSVEVRFPFWDKRLIEFCLSLPPEQKIKKGWTRMVMRRAMAGILPPEIQWRPGKSNLGPSFRYGVLKFGQKFMDKFIVNNPEIIADYVDIKSLREAHKRLINLEASKKDVSRIYSCITLALWLQKQADM
jgi:asparagine synthase (glutamine-hydrolysing)